MTRLRITWRSAIPAATLLVLVGIVATAGLLNLRGGAQTESSAPGGSPWQGTPQAALQGTGLVARLPLTGSWGAFSWAPDGGHLLVRDDSGSRVYDRFGKLVSEFGAIESWLDANHLIGGDGLVADIHESHKSGADVYPWVVPNGHGSAAIIVAEPGCVGDPIIDWYENGGYVKAELKATPYGWSPDGKLLLLGHLDCSDEDAQLHGWKGRVDVIDFASGRVLATAPAVRGEMAFDPSANLLAAQSDANLEIVTVNGGEIRTIPGARFLSWLDDSHLFYSSDSSVRLLDLASRVSAGTVVGTGEWQVPSSAGPRLLAAATGAARRIVGSDGTTTLLDLYSTSLPVDSDQMSGQAVTALQQSPWSPDGRMLALASSDGTSVVLFSVDPTMKGSIGGALPTPIGSPQALQELDRTALPGPVSELVSDPKRDALWFLGGDSGGPIELYRYDVATASLSAHAIAGTTSEVTRDQLAIAPTGELWIGAGDELVVYDPEADGQASQVLPTSVPDVQVDPKLGKADPWIAGIAFDGSGQALVARNWVRSLAQVAASLHVTGRVDVSDGFAMTGGLVVAGGRVYVLADPASGLTLGVDATGTGKLANVKFEASGLAAVGDRVLTAGTPPGWIDAQGGGAAMIGPVMASADLVAAGPDEVAVLYSKAASEIQWRDKDAKVSAQGVFVAGTAPEITALGFDAQGRLWAIESAGGSHSLARLSVGP